jgi:ATP-binding cassette, subfamily B, multidrug efflux pump
LDIFAETHSLFHLSSLKKYFWRYRVRLLLGVFFIIISNYFGVLAPQVTGYVIDRVTEHVSTTNNAPVQTPQKRIKQDILVQKITTWLDAETGFQRTITICGIVLLLFALLRGFFMFLMRQTIIVMSRHIEYDQKNDIFQHYQQLDIQFYKTHSTGDLMNRITEDVSRVRMFTGPALMYSFNLFTLISLSLYFMFRTDVLLSIYVIAPLPLLAFIIYRVNNIINRKSEQMQEELSLLTGQAQESYAGVRVIKSFNRETERGDLFDESSARYRKQAVSLARTESWYFPSIALLIGLSTLLTIMIGGLNGAGYGKIGEFVMYINMLTFPVSAIGWVASIVQRAAASQKRINEFLLRQPAINDSPGAVAHEIKGGICFRNVDFTYPETGIRALKNVSFTILPGEKVAIIGKTGSGKSTLVQLLLRFYEPTSGQILLDGKEIKDITLSSLRGQTGYVPQDVFLFSDTIANNISFGKPGATTESIQQAAGNAYVASEINSFPNGYETLVGERGVTLSGGQKQRVSIARALIRECPLVLFDDCLSAVDVHTEKDISRSLETGLEGRTALFITHRVLSSIQFDRILVLDNGLLAEEGTHEALMTRQGLYSQFYLQQQRFENEANTMA